MIRHIVAWNFPEEFSPEEKQHLAKKIKEMLEALATIVPGIVSIKVFVSPDSSSDRDIILDSLLLNKEALEAYRVHPAHLQAGKFIGAVVKDRVALDFEA